MQIEPSTALLMAAVMSSMLAGLKTPDRDQPLHTQALKAPSLSSRQVRSTTETSGVGTRNAMPVNLPEPQKLYTENQNSDHPFPAVTEIAVSPWPLRAGITLPTA